MDTDLFDPHSRRSFLGRMSAAGLGVLASEYLLTGCSPAKDKGEKPRMSSKIPGIPGQNLRQQVLNFALALETMEADLYRQALNKAAGMALSAPLNPDPTAYRLAVPALISGGKGAVGFQYLVDFTAIEAAHRDFLRMAIQAEGAVPIAPHRGGYRFPGGIPNDLEGILHKLLAVEEVGQRAYLGATPLIDDLKLLQTAATIHSTEAAHAAAIADVLGINPGPRRMQGDKQVFPTQFSDEQLEFFQDPPEILKLVKPYMV